MLIKKKPELTYADVTPKALYMGRRNFLLGLAATSVAVAGYKEFPRLLTRGGAGGSVPVKLNGVQKWPYSTNEAETPYDKVTTYNNYYEFGTDKDDPSKNAKGFVTSPWSVSVEGECAKPRKYTMDEILKLAPLEERIYRHRCVEAWSIVVPWIGYSLSTIVKLAEPTPKAKYVAFESYYDPRQMPLWQASGNPTALRRRAADGRGDESAGAALRGHVRRDAAESGWRAGAHGDSLEIRIQEHQVARENTLCKRSAAHNVEYLCAQRIWLLFECESSCGPSSLEPSDGTPHRAGIRVIQ